MTAERFEELKKIVPEIKGCIFEESSRSFKVLTSYVYPAVNMFNSKYVKDRLQPINIDFF